MSERDDFEARLHALEKVVAFLVASQHLQTPEPSAALARLQYLLLSETDAAPGEGSPEPVMAAEQRLVEMIVGLQAVLPRRLVDS